jgi:23S rRNA (cytosine1962-C5)-methyltransferase
VTDLDLALLPRPGEKRVALRVTKDAIRQIRGGHPWVFESSVSSRRGDGAPGDLAVVFDDDRRFVGIGLYDPTSPIVLRVLHHGPPVTIDADWFAKQLDAALARRLPLAASSSGARSTTGYRVVHGENDGLPGFVVDRYDTTYVLKLYTQAWIPHLATLVPLLRARADVERIVVRTSRELQRVPGIAITDGMTIVGDEPQGPVLFTENGLTFEADVVRGQKTGHFLDQRENRQRVRDLANGRRVLDVFACTGGFSVHAAAGGATSVHSVDLSAPALATAQRNMAHNIDDPHVHAVEHRTTVGDAFAVLRDLAASRTRYGLVVVDPPSFAAKRADVPGGMRAYRKLTELAVALVEPGGVFVQSSCSSRIPADEFFPAVVDAAGMVGVHLDVIDRTTHALDHPISFPQGAYLKTLFARV